VELAVLQTIAELKIFLIQVAVEAVLVLSVMETMLQVVLLAMREVETAA
jgi:hypothetical protein